MNTIRRDLQGSTVTVSQAVARFNKANRMNKKGLVGSSLWDKGFNPNFPTGCSRSVSRKILMENNPVFKRMSFGPSRVKILFSGNTLQKKETKREHLEELREAKKHCVNKGKMSVIASNVF